MLGDYLVLPCAFIVQNITTATFQPLFVFYFIFPPQLQRITASSSNYALRLSPRPCLQDTQQEREKGGELQRLPTCSRGSRAHQDRSQKLTKTAVAATDQEKTPGHQRRTPSELPLARSPASQHPGKIQHENPLCSLVSSVCQRKTEEIRTSQ